MHVINVEDADGVGSNKDEGFAEFERWLNRPASIEMDRVEKHRMRSEEELKSGDEPLDINLETFRWLWHECGEVFGVDSYNRELSESSFWDNYAEYIAVICEQLDAMDDDELAIAEVIGIDDALEEHRREFLSNVHSCMDAAERRTGRSFRYGEMTGLYALLRHYGRDHNAKMHDKVYRYMYGDEAAGIDVTLIDELFEDDADEAEDRGAFGADSNGDSANAEQEGLVESDRDSGSGDADANRCPAPREGVSATAPNRMYVSDVVDMSTIERGKLNLVYAPCGCGKTYFIEHKLKESNANPFQDMLYLSPTVALAEAFRSRGTMREYVDRRGETVEFWKQDGVVAMTYAAFGSRIKRAKEEGTYSDELFWNDHSLICADELSQAIKQSHYGGTSDNLTAYALKELEKRFKNPTNTVVTVSATPKRLISRFFGDIHLVKTEPRPVGYTEGSVVKYHELDNLLSSLDPSLRGMIYVGRISMMNDVVSFLRGRGIHAIGIHSQRNSVHRMDDEQIAAVDSLVKDEMIPEYVQVLVINAAYETGLNIRPDKSHLDYIVVHNANEDVQTQVRGRYRGDIDTVYYRDDPGDEGREVSHEAIEPYLGVKLTKSDKNELRELLGFKDDRNRLLGWPSVRRILKSQGYEVHDKKSNGVRYSIIEDCG